MLELHTGVGWHDRVKKKTKNNSPSALFKAQRIQIFCSRLHFTFLCLDVIKYREETEENLQTKYYKFMGGKKGKEKKQIHGGKMGYSITVAGTSCSCKKNKKVFHLTPLYKIRFLADYRAQSKKWKLQIYRRRCLYELGVGEAFLKYKKSKPRWKKWLELFKSRNDAPKDTINNVKK